MREPLSRPGDFKKRLTVVGTYEDLAPSCPHDNFHKGPNFAGLDPLTKRLTRLFNPRRQRWGTHFAREGPVC